MACLEFRHPQFSEDFTWLPAWLQRDQLEEACGEYRNQNTPSHSIKDWMKNITRGKDVDSLSREEGRYSSCYLALSGEDNLTSSFSASPGHDVHFHLHLSSNGAPLCTGSEISNHMKYEMPAGAGQKSGRKNVLSSEEVKTSVGATQNTENGKFPAESSAGSGGKVNDLKTDNNEMNISSIPSCPEVVKNLSVQSQVKNQEGAKCSEKFKKAADVNDLIELSISASEALVIHELAKMGPATENYPTAAVIEAALQVKQARLENQEYASYCLNEEIDETQLVMDLDDLTMVDAFDDVGLSSASTNEKYASASESFLLKNSSLSKHYKDSNDNGFKHVESSAHQNKFPCDPHLNMNISHIACQIDPVLHQSTQETSNGLDAEKPEAGMNSFDASSSKSAGKDEISYLVKDRFKSRWFGGWNAKVYTSEVNALAHVEECKNQSILKLFVTETSSLSESADVAPDMNSFMKKDETELMMASQSSIPSEGFNNKADRRILISQDVTSPSQSFIDPLCSFVPCSISIVNTNPLLAKIVNVTEAHAQTRFLEVEHLHIKSDLNAEFISGGRQDIPPFIVEGFENPVQGRLPLSPRLDSVLEKERFCCDHLVPLEFDEGFISLQQNMDYMRSMDRAHPKGFLSVSFQSKFATAGEDEETYKAGLTNNFQENSDNLVRDGSGFQFQPEKENSTRHFLNQGTCFAHTSKLIRDGLSCLGKPNPDEAGVKLHQRDNFINVVSSCKNSLDTQFLIRKRIRLSEAEVNLPQNSIVEMLQSSYKFHSTTRAYETSKCSNACIDKSCFSTHRNCGNRMIFYGIKFLLTGFSAQKKNELEALIHVYGGLVLLDIPPKSQAKKGSKSNLQLIPIIICPKKLKTTKFLYGCAVNAFILKASWLTDSVAAGTAVLLEKYLILSNQGHLERVGITEPVSWNNRKNIFDRVGIMLHGKPSFCTKFSVLVKHGGGKVFKALHWLVQSLESQKIFVGVVLAENERRVSRHLRHCALERKIAVLPASWIIKSLYLGKLLPFTQNK